MRMSENENKKSNKLFDSLPKWLKSRWFLFFGGLVLVIFGAFFLLVIDKENALRPGWLNIKFFNKDLPEALHLDGISNISMFSWFAFFLLFGIILILCTALVWYKYGKAKKAAKWCKYYEEAEWPKSESVKYTLTFYGVTFLVAAAYFAVVILMFTILNKGVNIADYFSKHPDVGQEFVKLLGALGILVLCILFVPVCIFAITLLLFILVKLLSLIVGGVASTVFKSSKYQEAATNAQLVQDRIREEVNAEMAAYRAARRAGAQGGSGLGGTRAKAPVADVEAVFPGLVQVDKKYAEIEAEKAAQEQAEKEKAEAEAAALAQMTPEEKAEHAAKEREELLAKAREEAAAKEGKTSEKYEVIDGFPFGKYQTFCTQFRAHLANQRKLYYKIGTLRAFVAAFAATRLVFLQGLSGTGKSTLPREFMYFVGGAAKFFPVQASWRDKTDILGYYSDLTGSYKESEILITMYDASYRPKDFNLMVLDEMNIARPEYYFADFLSVFEYPSSDWLIKIIQPAPGQELPKHIEKGYVRIPTNTWYIGTLNIDDSTYTLSDKIYDRAIAIDFNESNQAFTVEGEDGLFPTTVQDLEKFFELAKKNPKFNLTEEEQAKFDGLCKFIADTFEIKFGNRIIRQIENFLPVYVALGGSKEEALDHMFATKVMRKLDAKYESYMDAALVKLERYVIKEYGKDGFQLTQEIIKSYKRRFD